MEIDFSSNLKSYNKYHKVFEMLMEKTFKFLILEFTPIISVNLTNNEFIHELNLQYRKIDRPTDVISFAFLDGEERTKIYSSKEPVCLGDIYISTEKAEEQAKEYGHSISRELCFLFVHGLLHLLGYDHMKQEDEKIMFKLQEDILSSAEDLWKK